MATDYTAHSLRRGRIWKYIDISAELDKKKKPTTGALTASQAFSKSVGAWYPGATPPQGGFSYGDYQTIYKSLTDVPKLGANEEMQKKARENRYGFQFLWNPESLSMSTDLNLNVTPNTSDIFTTVKQAYPSMETISLNIVIDRSNDFAWARGLRSRGTGSQFGVNGYSFSLKEAEEAYNPKGRFGKPMPSLSYDISNMLKLGTVYDIEWLFRTINSNDGVTNVVGRTTYDNGFLVPNAVVLQLGPTMNSMAYLGWVSNVQVNHVAFTQEMIPIRSTVSIQFNVLSMGIDSSDSTEGNK